MIRHDSRLIAKVFWSHLIIYFAGNILDFHKKPDSLVPFSTENVQIDNIYPEVVLRNNDAIKFLKRKTEEEKVMKSPYYRGCALWDQLTFNIQLSANIYIFKNHLRRINLKQLNWR